MGANSGNDNQGAILAAASVLTLGPVAASGIAAGGALKKVGQYLDAPANAAKDAAQKQQDQQNVLIAQNKQEKQDQLTAAAQSASRDRARMAAIGNQTMNGGYNSTIMTSPLGVPNTQPQGGGKTLIGS